MTLNQLIIRADFLLEALPYIQRYRGETFVIKYGGSFMDAKDPEQRDSVARDITFLEAVGINPVVVHGGGKAITRALKDSGIETRFIQGMRVTDQQTMNVVEKVLSYEINPRIVETIQSFGGKAQRALKHLQVRLAPADADDLGLEPFIAFGYDERNFVLNDAFIECNADEVAVDSCDSACFKGFVHD